MTVPQQWKTVSDFIIIGRFLLGGGGCRLGHLISRTKLDSKSLYVVDNFQNLSDYSKFKGNNNHKKPYFIGY